MMELTFYGHLHRIRVSHCFLCAEMRTKIDLITLANQYEFSSSPDSWLSETIGWFFVLRH